MSASDVKGGDTTMLFDIATNSRSQGGTRWFAASTEDKNDK